MGENNVPESKFVQANGLRLHYLDWGNPAGQPVVMLHGIRLHAHCWNDFSRRLGGRYRVIALDARGHGDSDWSPEQDYSLDTLCEDLAAVLGAQDLPPALVIGHSMGARTAMLYTHLHPTQVARLVLVDMGPALPESIAKIDFSRVTQTAPPKDFASHEEATDYLAAILRLAPREMVVESVVHGMRQREDGRYVWKYDPALSGPPRPAPGEREWDLWEAALAISCPTLLLHGENSGVVTPEIAARMGSEMKDCRVEMVKNAGHALFTEQPAVFAESVERFFTSAARQKSG